MFVITGGGSGIGQALAWRLAEKEQSVLICGRRQSKLIQTQAKFPKLIDYLVGDLTVSETLNQLKQKVEGVALKGLVQNAAQLEPMQMLESVALEEFRAHQEINFYTPLKLFQQLRTHLSNARVLHISSAAAHYPFHSWGAYCISKASLYMLYQMLKKECPDIHFGSVMPGVTDTDMQGLIRQSSQIPQQDKQYFEQLHQQQRLLSPDVVGQFLSWLLLDSSQEEYSSKEWDIYDKSHHPQWLRSGQVQEI